ncbi:hypothetical protein DB032_09450 [Chromobacterium sp. Panama]|uniref:hypothetical protein n=1 Tax=Chromobacterium sp. Panama TaxID=2161826 RepID=UPI000D3172E1|nr:hypothetical protein [Chromobacterium sp. Panama]PTU65137.1 hypothetical protein DB032_09450 [Chromobacterium sp. Panama]
MSSVCEVVLGAAVAALDIVKANGGTVVAILAMIATGWQAWLTRRHNKLSVRPALAGWEELEEEELCYAFSLSNNGIGPAFIKSFLIFVDGKQVEGTGSTLVQKVSQLLFQGMSPRLGPWSVLVPGYYMRADEKMPIVTVTFRTEHSSVFHEVLRSARQRVRIIIKYESMYGESFTYDSNDFLNL